MNSIGGVFPAAFLPQHILAIFLPEYFNRRPFLIYLEESLIEFNILNKLLVFSESRLKLGFRRSQFLSLGTKRLEHEVA